MNAKFENTRSRIADEARGRYAKLVRQARRRTESAADRVVLGKKPVKTMSGLGLKLTAISHKTADQVLQQQTRLVDHQIDALVGRLKAVADASNVADLVRTQIRLIPQNVSRLAEDTRGTLSIVANAGVEVRDVLKNTIAELRSVPARRKPVSPKPVSKMASAPKAASKTVKGGAKKASKTRSKTGASKTAGATKAA
jgi:vacuolar-type H+-ATPase subunit E/Vma4